MADTPVRSVLSAHPIAEERALLERFHRAIEDAFETHCVDGRLNAEGCNFYSMEASFSAEIAALKLRAHGQKRAPRLEVSLWVIFLAVLQRDDAFCRRALKYQTLAAFDDAYAHMIEGVSEEERVRLWATANWMSVFVGMVPARRSKCLALKVVPRLVEGFNANYVQGSGQTRATTHRVKMFEIESGVEPLKKPKKRHSDREEDHECAKKPCVDPAPLTDDHGDALSVYSVRSLVYMMEYISSHALFSAEEKWLWTMRTIALPVSSAQRAIQLERLELFINLHLQSPLDAVNEVLAMDRALLSGQTEPSMGDAKWSQFVQMMLVDDVVDAFEHADLLFAG